VRQVACSCAEPHSHAWRRAPQVGGKRAIRGGAKACTTRGPKACATRRGRGSKGFAGRQGALRPRPGSSHHPPPGTKSVERNRACSASRFGITTSTICRRPVVAWSAE